MGASYLVVGVGAGFLFGVSEGRFRWAAGLAGLVFLMEDSASSPASTSASGSLSDDCACSAYEHLRVGTGHENEMALRAEAWAQRMLLRLIARARPEERQLVALSMAKVAMLESGYGEDGSVLQRLSEKCKLQCIRVRIFAPPPS